MAYKQAESRCKGNKMGNEKIDGKITVAEFPYACFQVATVTY